MAKTTKIKSVASVLACQSKDQVMDFIRQIGDKQREIVRIETRMNDKIAEITDSHKGDITKIQLEIQSMTTAVQTWCEANRSSLLKKGLKTANLITGEVSWRFNPPSVSLRKIDDVLANLKEKGLTRFIRIKEEVNKEAILAEPQAVADVAGISIKSGNEFFEIKPFEVDVK